MVQSPRGSEGAFRDTHVGNWVEGYAPTCGFVVFVFFFFLILVCARMVLLEALVTRTARISG